MTNRTLSLVPFQLGERSVSFGDLPDASRVARLSVLTRLPKPPTHLDAATLAEGQALFCLCEPKGEGAKAQLVRVESPDGFVCMKRQTEIGQRVDYSWLRGPRDFAAQSPMLQAAE